jgi:hypothetical protein
MQHRREGALLGFLAQDSGNVGVGVAGVDHQRQAGLAGGGDMSAEALLLGVTRRIVIMVVEPRLPDRHHLGMSGSFRQLDRADVEFLVSVVRMGTDRAEHVGKAL